LSIRLLLFGSIAEAAGRQSMILEAGDGLSVGDAIRAAGCQLMDPLLVAVNHELVRDRRRKLRDGDEVALMPPFSGG
jgi:molybdopterin converting factor small subunit